MDIVIIMVIDMSKVTSRKIKAALGAVRKGVKSGGEIPIAKNGYPIARISPLSPASGKRHPGSAKGRLVVSETFSDPLPADFLKEFEQLRNNKNKFESASHDVK